MGSLTKYESLSIGIAGIAVIVATIAVIVANNSLDTSQKNEEQNQKFQVLLDVFQTFASEDIIESRRIVITEYCNLVANNPPVIFNRTKEIRDRADSVQNSLTHVGEMIEHGVIDDLAIVFDQHGRMIIRQWQISEQDIEHQRNNGVDERGVIFEKMKNKAIEYYQDKYPNEPLPEPICN